MEIFVNTVQGEMSLLKCSIMLTYNNIDLTLNNFQKWQIWVRFVTCKWILGMSQYTV